MWSESEAVMKNIRIAFGQKLKTLRKKLRWSQEKLGEKADLHPTYVGGIERGERNISLEYIEKLASAFGLPMAELFDFASSESSEQQRLQSELILLIRQQDTETCEFLLKFLKMLNGLTSKKGNKRRQAKLKGQFLNVNKEGILKL
jgi:transcriptional regulator with XRE-family HTH domain